MDLIAHLSLGFETAFTPVNLLYCFVGVLLGTLVGVLPGGDHLGGGDLRGGDLDAAAAELDVQLDGGGGVEGAFHLCLQGVFVRRTSLLAARGAVLDRAC